MAVSTIAYHRGLFPDKCFKPRRSTNGVQIYQLVGNDEESGRMIDWLEEGVFSALDRRFLRRMTLVLLHCPLEDGSPSDGFPGKIIEKYSFEFSYESTEMRDRTSGVVCTSKDDALYAIESLLHGLVGTTQRLPRLPDHFYVDMILDYFQANLPPNYNPPFFKCGEETGDDPNVDYARIGEILTGYHDISIGMCTV
ncbi:meiosis-specific protein HOP1 [Perkinsela sp. CCAP 1560/4]|nr:meiosis-specific protein HOP1 [Perkinsela sp. CCAP 1560/4]|eukprot:KNH04216.1 meiosis-specific protein HOP1 [Perkinsela sp. CCAP 1560/4]